MSDTFALTSASSSTTPVVPTTTEPVIGQSQNAQIWRAPPLTTSVIPEGLIAKPSHDCFGTILSQIGDFIDQVWRTFKQQPQPPGTVSTPPTTTSPVAPSTPAIPGATGSTPAPQATTPGTTSTTIDDGIRTLMEKFSTLLDSLMDRIAALEQKMSAKKTSKKKKGVVAT